MILEQAFHTLPEILCGNHYLLQDHEGGLVSALSLALLQELNGRNVANPLSCIQAEKLYRPGGQFDGLITPRYLRADLYLSLQRLMVANRILSQYGWRHANWVEAKYFRRQTDYGSKHSGNKTNNVAALAVALMRLTTLVPETAGIESANARYLLHVYDSDPKWYLSFKGRQWLKSLVVAGSTTCEITNLQNEVASVRRAFGLASAVTMKLKVTNSVLSPLADAYKPVFHCVVSRIDSMSVTYGSQHFEIDASRNITETSSGDLNSIAKHVAENIETHEISDEEEDEESTDYDEQLDSSSTSSTNS